MSDGSMQNSHQINQMFLASIGLGALVAVCMGIGDCVFFGGISPALFDFVYGNLGVGTILGVVVGLFLFVWQSFESRFGFHFETPRLSTVFAWLVAYSILVLALNPVIEWILSSHTSLVVGLSVPLAMSVSWVIVFLGQLLVRRQRRHMGLPLSVSVFLLLIGSITATLNIVSPYLPKFLPFLSVVNVLLATASVATITTISRVLGRPAFAASALVLGVGGIILASNRDFKSAYDATVMMNGIHNRGIGRLLQNASDLDGDGYSHLFGGGDCAPWDVMIHPLGNEIIGNGVDDNCGGGDLVDVDLNSQPVEIAGPVAKNVFIFTIDTLRADVVGAEVNGMKVTPNLEQFANESIKFSRAYSPSTYTNEAVPSLFSGELPQRWHLDGIYLGQEPTLAQVFEANGYQTEAVIALPWLHDGAILGFDYVDNEFGQPDIFGGERGSDVVERMIQQIDQRNPKRPFFGWVHILEPHAPYIGRPETKQLGTDARGRYLQDVQNADKVFGEFVRALKIRGLLDEAIVVVLADHGEGLGEHGVATHVWGGWESIIKVPLLLHVPGESARVIDSPVSTLDMMPTILKLQGLEVGGLRDGRLLPQWGDSGDVHVTVDVPTSGPILRAMIREDFKIIWDVKSNVWTLFDVVKDPAETSPIDDQALLSRMKMDLLKNWDRTFNDKLIQRKADLWNTRVLLYPKKYKGDVGNTLELKRR